MKFPLYERQAEEYWDVIRWDPASFLTLHDGHNSRLYYDKVSPNWVQDLVRALRGILGGVVRILQALAGSLGRQRFDTPGPSKLYVLLLTIGGPKYASEEREIVETCNAKRVLVCTVHIDQNSCLSADGRPLSLESTLLPRDYVRVLSIWFREVFRGLTQRVVRDGKRRRLFAAVIPCIRNYSLYLAFARRIVAERGPPAALLTLAPSAAMSVAFVDCMKSHGVITGGIRTQTTSLSAEHLAINTDILFCKSPHERQAYKAVLDGRGPRLEEGCLLSLPEGYQLEPLLLPERFVLLLGTAPGAGQGGVDYGRLNERLFQVAAAAKLPIVFKGHNLASDLDESWFAGAGACHKDCTRETDMRRNRELVDRTALVISFPTTLLYYAILGETPVIVLDTTVPEQFGDEFMGAPIARISMCDTASIEQLDWQGLRHSTKAARSWFQEAYFLQKGADYVIDYLLRQGDHLDGDCLARRRHEGHA